jgi:hypothetical protein
MDHVMVRSINDLAKQMGKHTVAEFVENTQIIDKLIDLGVNYTEPPRWAQDAQIRHARKHALTIQPQALLSRSSSSIRYRRNYHVRVERPHPLHQPHLLGVLHLRPPR